MQVQSLPASSPLRPATPSSPTPQTPAEVVDSSPADQVSVSPAKTVKAQVPVGALTSAASISAGEAAGAALPGAAAVGVLTLPDGKQLAYPKADKSDTVETFAGVPVADPYHALQQVDSKSTKAWVAGENRATREYLDQLPGRAAIQSLVESAIPRDRRDLPSVVGDHLFYLKRTGEQDQAVLCSSDLDGGNEKTLVDPNPLNKEGTTGLNSFRVSPDGTKVAYAIQHDGTDWMQWKVRDIATGQDLKGQVLDSKPGDNIDWSSDSKGFFYPKYVRAHGEQSLLNADKEVGEYYHVAGTTESHDKAIAASRALSAHSHQPILEDMPRTQMVPHAVAASVNASGTPQPPADPGQDDKGNTWMPIGNLGDKTVYAVLPTGEGRGEICVAATAGASKDGVPVDSQVLVPEGKDALQGAAVVGDKVVGQYLKDGRSDLQRYDSQGKSLGPIDLPGFGLINGLRVAKDQLIFDYSAETYPPTIFKCDPNSSKPSIIFQAKCNYNPDDYETRLSFATSKDGTQVPMYITRRKDTPEDGQRPTYLSGYGGFDVNFGPDSKTNLNVVPWLNMGGVFVDTCLRGGSEYGEEWHKAGMLQNKQNVFDDYIGCAESLVKQGVTTSQHMAIGGRSNGGLLAAATTLERPDLFKAAIPEEGVMDLMHFADYTSGPTWVPEYGDVSNKADVENMLKYSPVNNVRPTNYPAMLILTGDHDDRVAPLHSYKLAAEMQQDQLGGAPILLKTERDVGHGSVNDPWPRSKLIKQDTDRWSFLASELGAKPPSA